MSRGKYTPRDDEMLYAKRVSPGGRTTYEPHSLVRDMCGLEPGHYRMWVRESSRHILCDVEPISANRARLLAAMDEARDAMILALHDANKLEGRCRELPREVEARGWAAFRKATGSDGPLTFGGVSMWDVVDAGMRALRKAMKA